MKWRLMRKARQKRNHPTVLNPTKKAVSQKRRMNLAHLETRNYFGRFDWDKIIIFKMINRWTAQNMEWPTINVTSAVVRAKCWKTDLRLWTTRMGSLVYCIPNPIAWRMSNWTMQWPTSCWNMRKRLAGHLRKCGAEQKKRKHPEKTLIHFVNFLKNNE